MSDDQATVISFARGLMMRYGRQLLNQCSCELRVYEKNGCSDIVTDQDLALQRSIYYEVKKHYPDHSMISEKNLSMTGDAPWLWVLDPIDGTSNYVSQVDNYAISLALYYNRQLAYGLVLDVAQLKLWEGAYTAGTVAVLDVLDLPAQNLLHLSYKTAKCLSENGMDVPALCEQFQGVRYLGCASLELCRLVQHRSGLYLSTRLKLWDFAAAACVLRASGCHLWAANLSNGCYLVVASRSLSLMESCLKLLPMEYALRLKEQGGQAYAAY
jgi:myo-inositol-1(or 4)-monophosphatase